MIQLIEKESIFIKHLYLNEAKKWTEAELRCQRCGLAQTDDYSDLDYQIKVFFYSAGAYLEVSTYIVHLECKYRLLCCNARYITSHKQDMCNLCALNKCTWVFYLSSCHMIQMIEQMFDQCTKINKYSNNSCHS